MVESYPAWFARTPAPKSSRNDLDMIILQYQIVKNNINIESLTSCTPIQHLQKKYQEISPKVRVTSQRNPGNDVSKYFHHSSSIQNLRQSRFTSRHCDGCYIQEKWRILLNKLGWFKFIIRSVTNLFEAENGKMKCNYMLSAEER